MWPLERDQGGDKPLRRIVITGVNGSGKSHFARRVSAARPDLTLHSYDAIRLTRNWVKRPQAEVARHMGKLVATDAWIIEGGPSLLSHALPRCQMVVWLDPPIWRLAWRLARRPWKNLGTTRPEMPAGNVDWPLGQYRFAWRSLWAVRARRAWLRAQQNNHSAVSFCQCRTALDVQAVYTELVTKET